ncbi:nuclear transport factor 2 family protein [Pleionea sp. CnH1-48]|uniref:nuclear transport factor 2 family protein n=1 Tax=Pleionea sp. CnH1-48 TaxID=2954494 RepID=UPI00209714EA|nr:nuclear transport factor 2 family protein [Pleionea sp. CnH1-48]MCO7225347.1 nuclear transport factor 2 family protein [Pleionea sp. CnH1-48]
MISRTLLFLSILIAAHSSHLQADSTSEIKQALERFNQAFMDADTQTLNTLLTSNYVHTNSGSKPFGKTAWLNWLKTRKQALQDKLFHYKNYSTEELSIQVYGDSAVVTGRNIAEGMNKGQPFQHDIRFTHLWIREPSGWKRAAFHDTSTKK